MLLNKLFLQSAEPGDPCDPAALMWEISLRDISHIKIESFGVMRRKTNHGIRRNDPTSSTTSGPLSPEGEGFRPTPAK